MKKRLLALAIVLVMIISMLPVTAFAAVPSKVKLYNYSPARKDLESVPSSTYLSSRVKYITVIDNTDTTEGAPAKVLSYPSASSTESKNPQDNFARYEYKIDSEGKGTVYLHLKNFDTTGLKQTDNGAFFQIGYGTSDNYDTVITLEGTNKITGAWEAIVIKGSGEVTITGSGSLHLYTNVQENDLFRIEGAGNLTIKDTTVTGHINTETNAKPGLRNAFTVNGNITVDGSNVDLIVNNGAAFRTATSSTGGLKANNVTIKNGSNVKVKQNAGQDAIVENSTGVLTIENSTVEFEGNNNGSLALKHAPTLVGNYSSQIFSVWPTTDPNFAATKYTPETAFATNVRYFKFVHECVAQEDDGDCTTAVFCACTKTEMVPASEEHSFTTKASEQLVEGTTTVYYVQCDNCNVVSEDVTIDTSSGEVVCNHPNAPEQTDCTVEVICPDCEEVAYAAKEHTPGAEATCTTAQVCTVCNAEIVAAKGHPLNAISAKAPTCTESGYDHHKFCPICERYFYWSTSSTAANNKDKTGYTTMNNWYKEALGHTEGEPTVDPETYEIVISCVTCQEELSRVPGEIPEPECTHENAPAQEFCDVAVNCPDCGEEVYAAKDHTEGAAADCENDQICTVCEKVLVEKLGHKPGAEADCENDQICTVCEKVLVEKLNHKPGAEADCENDQICTVCEKVLVEKLGHKPGAEADCENDQICTVCEKVLVEKLNHKPGAEADCENDQICTVCEKVLVEKLGHNPGAAATCTTNQTCTECGKELAPAEGHRYGSMQVFTFCEEEGYIIIGCNKCGGEWDSRTDKEAQDYLAEMNENPYINIDLSAKGHKPGAAATCTTAQLCTVCEKELAPAEGHRYGSMQVFTFCEEEGYIIIGCNKCGGEWDSRTDKEAQDYLAEMNENPYINIDLSAKGHKPGAEADCENDQICTVCEKVLVEKLGHKDVIVEGKKATCTEDGLTDGKYCEVCNKTLEEQKVITAAGHKYNQKIIERKYRKSAATINAPAVFYFACECGEKGEETFEYGTKASGAVASIGGYNYATVAEAIQAAKGTDKVVVLLKDFNNASAILIDGDVTIDFGGYTYTVEKDENGAALVITSGKVTLKNGKLQVRYSARNEFANLIVNNGTLITENITLNGANVYAEGETATIVNNGALEAKAGTVITAKEAALAGEGAVTKAEGIVLEAVEGYHWTTEGVMEKHSFTTTSKSATVYEVSYDLHECACGESYKDNYGTKRLSTMATIGDARYATLQEAIDAAEAGAVIKLTRKVNDGAAIELNKNVTIDLNGYVYTVATAKNGAAVVVAEGVEATLTNGTVQLRYAARADFEALIENNGILRINNETLKGNALVEGAVLVKGNEVLEVI